MAVLAEEQLWRATNAVTPDSTVKLGAWWQAGRSAGVAGNRQPDPDQARLGVYGVIDRVLSHGSDSASQSVDAFLRVGLTPHGSGLFSKYVDVGVGATGVFQHWRDDFLGIAAAYGRGDRSSSTLQPAIPERRNSSDEFCLELSYAARVAPCCVIQPDLQYLRYTTGSPVPRDTGSALVVGLRVNLALW